MLMSYWVGISSFGSNRIKLIKKTQTKYINKKKGSQVGIELL